MYGKKIQYPRLDSRAAFHQWFNCNCTLVDRVDFRVITRVKFFMIVKIQVSEFSSTGMKRVLIYNAERNIQWEQDINEDFTKIMDGQTKQFFFAKIDRDTKELLIGKQAPWQKW